MNIRIISGLMAAFSFMISDAHCLKFLKKFTLNDHVKNVCWVTGSDACDFIIASRRGTIEYAKIDNYNPCTSKYYITKYDGPLSSSDALKQFNFDISVVSQNTVTKYFKKESYNDKKKPHFFDMYYDKAGAGFVTLDPSRIKVWDLIGDGKYSCQQEAWERLYSTLPSIDGCIDVAMYKDLLALAVIYKDKEKESLYVKILKRDSTSFKENSLIQCPDTSIECMIFSPDGKYLFVGGESGSVYILEEKNTSWQITSSIKAHGNEVFKITCNKNGTWFATLSPYENIKIWKKKESEWLLTKEFIITDRKIYNMTPLNDGYSLFVGFEDGEIGIVTSKKDDPFLSCNSITYKQHEDLIVSMDYDEREHRLITGALDGTIVIWDYVLPSENNFILNDIAAN